jgi:NADH-quinone oxidoreductase subunit L
MVTAGVYLIARMHPLFEQAPAAADVGAIVGCATLLIAGTIGLAVVDVKRVIAYSTMSQIGYMIMGVSAGAYSAGMFHLMTHAFFKALLFMAAGSLIAAMGGDQSLDRMGGFRRALPFTYATFVIGGLALAGVPPLSGYFSKDDILLGIGARGGWHWALYVFGYIGALLTALYTFRLIFRAFWGEPVPEARELEQGHLHHAAQPTNPATGEVEDTDVGFPGPGHFIAERELPMRAAMVALAVLSVLAGIVAIPKATHVLEHFLAPTFADSRIVISPSDGLLAFGLALGALLSVAGIAVAYWIWVAQPETAAQLRERFAPVYRLFVNKWYFDELIDVLVVRPGAWFGRFSQQTFERVVVNGALVGGTVGIVRAGSAAVRAVQNGLLRYYAALLVLGVAAVTLYFLLRT